MDGEGVIVGVEVSLVLGSNESGRVPFLAGAMGNSYSVWLGRSKLKVGNETVTILFSAF